MSGLFPDVAKDKSRYYVTVYRIDGTYLKSFYCTSFTSGETEVNFYNAATKTTTRFMKRNILYYEAREITEEGN